MFFKQRNFCIILSLFYFTSGLFKVTNGNTIFRFGFDFGLKLNENSFETSFNIGDGKEEVTTTTTTTESLNENVFPTESSDMSSSSSSAILTDIWSRQAKLNATANDKLHETRVAVNQLNQEISAVVGRSDFIAAKVKLMTRYLNKANAAAATTAAGDNDAAATNRFLILQDYVQLVDDLRVPPTNEQGGERSLEYMVMKLGLEKHKLIELQTQILVEVLQALETWQTYVKTQLVDVVTV